MASYATIDDLKAATDDPDIAANDARAVKLLEWASAKIDEYCGQTFPIVEGGTIPMIVVQVAATVAGRAWANPNGAQSASETAGPFGFNTSFGSGQAVASVPMALRTSEKDDLSRYKVRRSGIGTIATYRPVPAASTNYVDVVGGDKPFPWPNPDEL